MELEAAIQSLQVLKEPCNVDLYSDSAYMRNGIVKWIEKWRARGWMTNGNVPVRNQDLWQVLDQIQTRHSIVWHWVKGHANNTYNVRCDRLAKLEIAKVNRTYSQAQLETYLSEFFNEHRRSSHAKKAE